MGNFGDDFLKGLLKTLTPSLQRGIDREYETRRDREKEERASAEKRSLADVLFQRQQQVKQEDRTYTEGQEQAQATKAEAFARGKKYLPEGAPAPDLKSLQDMISKGTAGDIKRADEEFISKPEQSLLDYRDTLRYFTEAKTEQLGQPQQVDMSPMAVNTRSRDTIKEALELGGWQAGDPVEGLAEAQRAATQYQNAKIPFQMVTEMDEEGTIFIRAVRGDEELYSDVGQYEEEQQTGGGQPQGGPGVMNQIYDWMMDQRGPPGAQLGG